MPACYWVRGEKRKEFAGDVENFVGLEGFVLLKEGNGVGVVSFSQWPIREFIT